MEGPELPLRPAGYRPRDMERGRGRRSPREDEGRQRGMGRIPTVDLVLQSFHVTGLDAVLRRSSARAHRELGLCNEEFVLQPAHELTQVVQLRGEARLHLTEVSPELVEGAVRADARRVLVYPRTMGETGRSAVARTGVETRDVLASGRQGNWSNGELRPWTGQNEMCSTSLCLAS